MEKRSPIVPVTAWLGDKEVHLKITLWGLKQFEDMTGKNLLKNFDLDSMSIGELTILMWACLLWEQPDLKLDDTARQMDDIDFISNLTEVVNRFMRTKKAVVESSPNALSLPVG